MTTSPDASPASHTRIGFIGLGHMGSNMARQLIKAGYDVTVWSRSAAHVDELVADGATRATSPAHAIATGHLFSMLANEDVVRQVCTPARLAAAPDGFIHVNHATISARAAEEFSGHAAANGYGYVAAPVVGRPNAAAAGALTILAAGAPDAVDASMPMLAAMGRRVWRYGAAAPTANLAKIAVNYLIVHALQALAESITLLERNGLDTTMFVQMINDSVFPGVVYGGYGDAIARGSYRPAGFTTVLGLKDLMLAIGAAEESGVRLPTGPVLQELLTTAVLEVGEDADWAAIAEITRRRSSHLDEHGPRGPRSAQPIRPAGPRMAGDGGRPGRGEPRRGHAARPRGEPDPLDHEALPPGGSGYPSGHSGPRGAGQTYAARRRQEPDQNLRHLQAPPSPDGED